MTAATTTRRLAKALLIAMIVGVVSIVLTALTHLPFSLLWPITAGWTAGHYVRLRPGEAVGFGLVLALTAWLPLPILYWGFGVLSQLAPGAILFLASVAALYCGGLATVLAWVGGATALGDELEQQRAEAGESRAGSDLRDGLGEDGRRALG